MKALYFFLAVLTGSLSGIMGFGQSIINQSARVLDDGDLVEIKYTLQGQKGEVYDVSVYGSHDDFAKPLISVTGDVGSGIETGAERTISWQPKTELVKFAGQISFEIKAELSAAPILITSPNTQNSVFKRGKEIKVSWNGGAKQENFQVQLLKSGIDKFDIDTVTIQNIYNNNLSWKIPGKLRKGDDYQIRITSVDRSNVHKQSPAFTIKPRLPLAIKIVPLAAGLITAAILLRPERPLEQLPGPPTAPR
jgi:hypothetical protein